MRCIVEKLEAAGYKISEQSADICCASKFVGEYVNCKVTVSAQDIDGLRFFVHGYLEVKEIISEETLSNGEKLYWTAVGREIGPEGMYVASSHCAGGWPIDLEIDAASAIKSQLLVWLDKYSQVDKLIEMLEDLYFKGEKIPLPQARTGLAKAMLNDLGLRSNDRLTHDVLFRPMDTQLLANLYYGTGKIKRAQFYIGKWIEARANAVEPEYIELQNRLKESE